MKDFEYRGRRLDNKEWVYGHYFITPITAEFCVKPENGAFFASGDEPIRHCIVENMVAFEIDPATVGQYTGLKDKNGKDIWEGDIFKDDNHGIVRSIFRVPGGFAFEDNPVSFGYDHRAPVYPYSPIADSQNVAWLAQCCEVIGNIHDNPELLK